MLLNEESTVFDLLAILCSLFTKEEERLYSIRRTTADEKHVQIIISTYKNFLALILNAADDT